MLQSFAATTTPGTGAARLRALRREMRREGLSGFIVPRSDAHMGENVAPRDERLAWLTGFTGTAGRCVVLQDKAGIFVDGRYRLQVQAQVDTAVFTPVPVPDVKTEDWLGEHLAGGGTLGYDPWLHGAEEIEKLSEALAGKGGSLRPVDNPIDRIWTDQPPPPRGRIVPYPERLAGEGHASKRRRLAATLRAEGLSAAVLNLPDSIAWLLNIRGSDIARTPVAHAFAILHADATVDLFVDPAKVDDAVREHLGTAVRLRETRDFAGALDRLKGEVAVDRATAPVRVSNRLAAAGAGIRWRDDPCILPKATKNEAEISGARAAHLRDGVAFARFLHWLGGTAPSGSLTEIDAVRKLEDFRRETGALRDIAFDTISGAGPNGAIVHYRVTEDSNRPIVPGDIFLVDSGAQYEDGTTDITRTVATGPAGADAARAFTLVLKGMIAISTARWPEGLAGRDIDALARADLWRAGLDYDHGTGHGVGAYLSVHEGPQSISRRGNAELLPGMIVSNEPGYYHEGAFGIRIENLLVVMPPQTPAGGDRPMLGFETLTLAPVDRRLVRSDLLTRRERDWLNAYHARVREELSPLVDAETGTWLAESCAPL
ncbi:MAG: aminopeptidase P family protein [Paracoccaceae bacterium]